VPALQVKYGYVNGILASLKDVSDTPNVTLWTANTTNPVGQITEDTLGNGVVRNTSYDAVTARVNSIQAGVGGGSALQNQSFLFDAIGNLTQRQENNLGLTENFNYDTLYRLTSSTLTNSSVTTTNLTVTYDATGNITSRSDYDSGAAWTYDTNHIHQVTALGPYPLTYDANGNTTERSYGGGITWTSYNYPSLINYKSGSSYAELATFYYDQNRQRYYQTYTNSSNQTETTYYVGGLLEKTLLISGVTDWRHYVYAGNQPVAIVSRQSSGGTNSIHYVLEDHLGSTAAFLDSSGNATVTESFTPFGYGRNASTWAPPVPGTIATTVTGISAGVSRSIP
jgi:YD repeat-containing protein